MKSFWKGFVKSASVKQVACVAVTDGKVILMGKRRDNNKWTGPGGHMEPGEKPVAGAKRELFEESGINVPESALEFLSTKRITKPDGTKLIVHGFKLDSGKTKTSMTGDPDQEVFRWNWEKLPLRPEVAENLHVQKDNVLFDALGIDYPQEKTATSHFPQAVFKRYQSKPEGAEEPQSVQVPPNTQSIEDVKSKTASAKITRMLERLRARRHDPAFDKIRDQLSQNVIQDKANE